MTSCPLPATSIEETALVIDSREPTPFAKAYPAPWRISGDQVFDADGREVTTFESDDRDELAFWRGIVLAVNIRETLIEELQHARHYVSALAKRAPEIGAVQADLARLDLVIQQSGAR